MNLEAVNPERLLHNNSMPDFYRVAQLRADSGIESLFAGGSVQHRLIPNARDAAASPLTATGAIGKRLASLLEFSRKCSGVAARLSAICWQLAVLVIR